MARKKKAAEAENHERWMVSYADFVTLLFAFFVVMFASSQADKGKAKQVSDSVRQALEEGQVTAVLAGILGDKGAGNAQVKGPGGVKELPNVVKTGKEVELGPTEQALNAELKFEIDNGQIKIAMEARGLVITLREAAFFPSGDDRLVPRSFSSLEKIGALIARIPNPVRLEGHTDAVPIHNSRFRSNWELSAARGIAMLEYFSGTSGVPRDRLAVVGYADTLPADSNETPEGRARNRRVDVVLLNRHGMTPEPKVRGGNTKR
jgi:chemotaxis protein MotB